MSARGRTFRQRDTPSYRVLGIASGKRPRGRQRLAEAGEISVSLLVTLILPTAMEQTIDDSQKSRIIIMAHSPPPVACVPQLDDSEPKFIHPIETQRYFLGSELMPKI